MDERKAQLKQLKKACKKAKGKTVTGWKTLSVFLLVVAVVFSLSTVAVKISEDTAAAFLGGNLYIKQFFTFCKENLNSVINSSAIMKSNELLLMVTVIAWVLFAGTLILWILGKNKWKKTDEYLNYRTLKNALNAEKKEK